MLSTILFGSFAVLGIKSVAAVPALSVTPASVSGAPGYVFTLDISIADVTDLNTVEFVLGWSQGSLKFRNIAEGPFLPSVGGTYWVYAVGVAGENVKFGDMITSPDGASGSGVLATVTLEVIGGGSCDITLSGIKLLDTPGNEMSYTATGGFFQSIYPFAAMTWYVPTRQPDGVTIEDVEGGVIYYDDLIKFDASASYATMGKTIKNVHWLFQFGGVDVYIRTNGAKARQAYAVHDPVTDTYTYYTNTGFVKIEVDGVAPELVFLWAPGHTWNPFLGWTKMTLTVTDSADLTTTYVNWIQIMQHAPGRLVMQTKTTAAYHIKNRAGAPMEFMGQVQNRAGLNIITFEYIAGQMEIGRWVISTAWGAVRFDIKDMSGATVKSLITVPQLLQPTENSANLGGALWTGITAADIGNYQAVAYLGFSPMGVAFPIGSRMGYNGFSTNTKSFAIMP